MGLPITVPVSDDERREWPARADHARLHYVTGKGGTGKSTVSAALALALAAGGRRVLLVEVEGRQSIAQLFDLPPLAPEETVIATAEGGGEVLALALDIEHAFLEYLAMFYNLGFAGRAMRRMGAVEFVTTIAPGLRDVILTGKIKECTVRTDRTGRHVYDEVVVDAPPTGRIAAFLDVSRAMIEVARGGPIASQAEGVATLLHSDQTVLHLVTLLEALPVQETLDAITELTAADFRIGVVVVNRATEGYLPAALRARAADGDIDIESLAAGLKEAGISLSDRDFQGLLRETVEHSASLQIQDDSSADLARADIARLSLPTLPEGMDLGGIYELAAALTAQGVR